MLNTEKLKKKDKIIYTYLFGGTVELYYFGTLINTPTHRKQYTNFYFATKSEYIEKFQDVNSLINNISDWDSQDEFLELGESELPYLHEYSKRLKNRIIESISTLNKYSKKIRYWKNKAKLFESPEFIDFELQEKSLAMRGVYFYKTRLLFKINLLRLKFLLKPVSYICIFLWDNFSITFEKFDDYQTKKENYKTLTTNKEYMTYIQRLTSSQSREQLTKKAEDELKTAQQIYFEINKSFISISLAIMTIIVSFIVNSSEFITKKKELEEMKEKLKKIEMENIILKNENSTLIQILTVTKDNYKKN